MKLSGKHFILIKLLETSMKLERGNKKSKRIAKMIETVCHIFKGDEFAFEMMVRNMEGDYVKFSQRYNRDFYDKVGGERGSGKLVVDLTSNISKKTGIDLDKHLKGIDPEGFYYLQTLLPFTMDISMGKAPIGNDNDLETFKTMMSHLNRVLWAIFISVFYEDYADSLSNNFNRFDLNNSSLN